MHTLHRRYAGSEALSMHDYRDVSRDLLILAAVVNLSWIPIQIHLLYFPCIQGGTWGRVTWWGHAVSITVTGPFTNS